MTPTKPKLIMTKRNVGQSTTQPNWSFTIESTSWPPTKLRIAVDANMMYPPRNCRRIYNTLAAVVRLIELDVHLGAILVPSCSYTCRAAPCRT